MRSYARWCQRMAGVLARRATRQEHADETRKPRRDADRTRTCARACPPKKRGARPCSSWGGWKNTRQAYRERGTVPFLENLLYDIRYTLRQWRREPGFAITAAIILALGIGASAAIFSVVNPILFRPLPYPGADRITMVWESRRGERPMPVAFATFSAESTA